MARTTITGNVGNYTLPAGPPNDTSTAGVNIVGVTIGNLIAPLNSHDTINLEAHSEWIGGYSANTPSSAVTITGKGLWENNTTSSGNATIGVRKVSGNGVLLVGASRYGGTMTFLKGTTVGAGQTVEIAGTNYRGAHGDVEIHSPSLFHAAVQLGFGQLELDGLKGTSYSLKNDLLTIFNGHKVVDTLRFETSAVAGSAPPTALVVSQNAGGITIHADGNSYTGGGHALPLQV